MREDQRVIRTVRLKEDDAICKTCTKPMQQGKLVYWSQGGFVWHLTCDAPKMPAFHESDAEADARLNEWMERKIEQEAERRGEGGPVSAGAVGVSTSDTSGVFRQSQAPTTTPASLTSNPKHAESF